MIRELFLYSKSNCPLCDALKAELDKHNLQYHVIMIDNDPELTHRYGARAPVLEAGNILLCEGHFQHEKIMQFVNQ